MSTVQIASDEPFITASDVAAMLGTNPRWVVDKAREGSLPVYKLPGSNKLRFLASEIREAMRSAE